MRFRCSVGGQHSSGMHRNTQNNNTYNNFDTATYPFVNDPQDISYIMSYVTQGDISLHYIVQVEVVSYS